MPQLLIPGLLATGLKIGNRDIWPTPLLPDPVSGFRELALHTLGVDRGGLLLRTPDNNDQYASFFQAFPHSAGRGYDWRRSIDDTSTRLAAELLGTPGSLDFVTHSTGALVLVNALAKAPSVLARVAHIVFVAPPFHGTLEALAYADWSPACIATMTANDCWLKQTLDGAVAAAVFFANNCDPFVVTSSWQGLWDLVLAPKGNADDEFPLTVFGRPVPNPVPNQNDDIWNPQQWVPQHQAAAARELPRALLQHATTAQALATVLGVVPHDKISVVITHGGHTQATVLHDNVGSSAATDKFWRADEAPQGDGTVLPASSYVPGLPVDRYFGWAGPMNVRKPHGTLLSTPEVQALVKELLADAPPPSTLQRGNPLMSAIFPP